MKRTSFLFKKKRKEAKEKAVTVHPPGQPEGPAFSLKGQAKEKASHPLQRIMDIEKTAHGTMITTTDIHLARGIGDALHHAYRGELEFHYNPEQNLLRVTWSH